VRLFTPAEVAVLAYAALAATWLDALKGLGMSTWLIRRLPVVWRDEPGRASRLIRTYLYCSAVPLAVCALGTWWGALGPAGPRAGRRPSAWPLALLAVVCRRRRTISSHPPVLWRNKRLAVWNTWFSVTSACCRGGRLRRRVGFERFLWVTCCSLGGLVPALPPLRRWLSTRGAVGGRLARFAPLLLRRADSLWSHSC
jgi:hypothetical protein